MTSLLRGLLAAALVLTAPGLAPYEAAAQVVRLAPVRSGLGQSSGYSGARGGRFAPGGTYRASANSFPGTFRTLPGAPAPAPAARAASIAGADFSPAAAPAFEVEGALAPSIPGTEEAPRTLGIGPAPIFQAPAAPAISNLARDGSLSGLAAVPGSDSPESAPQKTTFRGQRGLDAARSWLISRRENEEISAPSSPHSLAGRASLFVGLSPAGGDSKEGQSTSAPAPAPGDKAAPKPDADKSWLGLGKMAVLFILALIIAQIGVESLGAAMPALVKKSFGDITKMAELTIFSSISGILGRTVGQVAVKKWGLKTTFLVSTGARVVSISILAGLLATGHMVWPLMIVFFTLNGFLGGIAATAEASIPPAIYGPNQTKLERFWTWEQTLLEIVGVAGPILTGAVVASWGFLPPLLAFPVSFIISIALMVMFLRLPSKAEALGRADGAKPKKTSAGLGALARGELLLALSGILAGLRAAGAWAAGLFNGRVWQRAPKPVPTQGGEKKPEGFGSVFKELGRKIVHGARVVWRDPLLRTTFFAYTAFMLLNPFLYTMLAPNFGVALIGEADESILTSVIGMLTGLYSLGGLLGGFMMMFEQRKIKRLLAGTPDRPAITAAEENELMRRSMLRWMKWGTFGLAAIATMALPLPMLGALVTLPAWLSWAGALTLPALALIPFGVAQVISMVKLKSYFQSKAPEKEMVDAMGFFGSASLAASTVGILALKYLFKGFEGFTPFYIIAGAMIPLAVIYVYLTRRLAAASGPDAGPNNK